MSGSRVKLLQQVIYKGIRMRTLTRINMNLILLYKKPESIASRIGWKRSGPGLCISEGIAEHTSVP